MDYAELVLPPALDGLVAAVWTAAVPADAGEWVTQEAVPDGCIELIRRHTGRAVWRREQPELFATGLATVPARLSLGGGARFTGIKLWPWAWNALGGTPCAGFADDWIPIADPRLAGLTENDIVGGLIVALADVEVPTLGRAILASGSVADIVRCSGLSHRQLQRRFATEIGMPPRSYLRLLRFRDALKDIQSIAEPLACTAVAQGYADQAHMAREFRDLAGMPPSIARTRAKGPFV